MLLSVDENLQTAGTHKAGCQTFSPTAWKQGCILSWSI